MRSCSLSVLVHKTTEEIASVDSGRLDHAGKPPSDGWFRRLQPERPGELRVPVAQEELQPPSSVFEHEQQVAGLLGDPQTAGGGGHPGQVDPPRVEFDRCARMLTWTRPSAGC
jgi:hypothetical protein